ncbi:spondin domain-containing protein [Niabella ginsengisoli]|uniref:Spondin domain-containing protein n=1 Tax=Niabella ginsengisoli TaxID=522298 RepID=A0ABS9SLX2_9BACT|nr:spondin domain-containing protein [Niabella ginsengisoli]MCH5599291.1 spondin domain-containing protein [Niabella ginsengisoli]
MTYQRKNLLRELFMMLPVLAIIITSCERQEVEMPEAKTITIENVLDSRPLVQSGTFKGAGNPPVIFPGQSVTITFSAAKGQALSFATMYGWSNDLFFAPENPGIKLYEDDGTPITGDVSDQIKLWDNGTRINQVPGSTATHPGTAETSPKNIKEVDLVDDQGNVYLEASKLMNLSLAYDGKSMFTLTIKNNSGGTINETPFSPGVWSVSYIVGGDLLNEKPIYEEGKPSANGLTNIAEMGDIATMSAHLTSLTGIFTPLSPILVVVYNGNENPFYKAGEKDRGEGLKELAQTGNADVLAAALKTKASVKDVYILKESVTTLLLPMINGNAGGKVSQQLSLKKGDKIALATMYGLSNDWFFATTAEGISGATKGDVSSQIKLYDNGTSVSQYPGAGISQAALGGTPMVESKVIEEVPNPNAFTTLPPIIKVNIN